MIDSNNIEIMRDNLKELDQKIENLDVEIPPHTQTDAGKYLGVDSSGDLEFSNPPEKYNLNFSTTEQDTGAKWIDGREIYCKVITSNIGSEEDITISLVADALVMVEGITVNPTSGKSFDLDHYISWEFVNNVLTIKKTSYVNNFTIIVWYVKTTPAPEPETLTKKKKSK